MPIVGYVFESQDRGIEMNISPRGSMREVSGYCNLSLGMEWNGELHTIRRASGTWYLGHTCLNFLHPPTPKKINTGCSSR